MLIDQDHALVKKIIDAIRGGSGLVTGGYLWSRLHLENDDFDLKMARGKDEDISIQVYLKGQYAVRRSVILVVLAWELTNLTSGTFKYEGTHTFVGWMEGPMTVGTGK